MDNIHRIGSFIDFKREMDKCAMHSIKIPHGDQHNLIKGPMINSLRKWDMPNELYPEILMSEDINTLDMDDYMVYNTPVLPTKANKTWDRRWEILREHIRDIRFKLSGKKVVKTIPTLIEIRKLIDSIDSTYFEDTAIDMLELEYDNHGYTFSSSIFMDNEV